MSDMIPVPSWGSKSVDYLLRVDIYVNGVLRYDLRHPPNLSFLRHKYRMQILSLFSRFLFGEVKPIHDLMKARFYNPDLKWSRFLKSEVEEPEEITYTETKRSAEGHKYTETTTYRFRIQYLRINESIVPYLKEVLSPHEIDYYRSIKSLFDQTPYDGSYDQYLSEKADYLLNLDLESYFKDDEITSEKV